MMTMGKDSGEETGASREVQDAVQEAVNRSLFKVTSIYNIGS